MKVLKLIEHGLICHETFDGNTLAEPLINNSNYVQGDSCITINRGSIYMSLSPYPNLVFEIDNDFIPSAENEVGGISIIKGSETRDLHEYYNELNNESAIKYVKVVKNGDIFTGYGSDDEIDWIDKGYIYFPNAETVGVTVNSTSPYVLNKIKVYRDEFINIEALMPGYRVEVYKYDNLVTQALCTTDKVSLQLPYYPFLGTFKIYDDEDNLISDTILDSVWGGDYYICTLNVDLKTEDNIPLTYDIAKHLGNLSNGMKVVRFKAVNNSEFFTTVTIKVADYSPFGDWVFLSEDYGNAYGELSKGINISINGLDTEYFWLVIQKPANGDTEDFDFKHTECLFYLCVE